MDEPRGRVKGGSGPVTVGGFAGFGFGVFWYAWGKVGFWKAVLSASSGSPGLGIGSRRFSSWGSSFSLPSRSRAPPCQEPDLRASLGSSWPVAGR